MRAFIALYLSAVVLLAIHSHIKIPPESLPDFFHTRMYDGYVFHKSFSRTARTSETLQQAVQEYRKRYHKYPPPRFDAWYEYATARHSAVVDRFDGLWHDMQPFYALDPKEIRSRTQDLINDPNNDIAGVTIRDGRAHAGPNIPAKHEWAIEGVVKMINQFAEHLPDMDLAFNTNDANRVVVPFERIEYLRRMSEATNNDVEPKNEWQPGRSSLWPRLTGDLRGTNIMHQLSPLDNVYRYAAAGCPPSSPARRQNYWKLGTSCTHCALPDSHNVDKLATKRADACAQPDLQHLHGAYSAPAVSKVTNKLYPIFSQSRVPGFHDILYPSAWDYVDRTAYQPGGLHQDPVWADKTNVAYWRGSTTEGVSDGKGAAKWQGMLRQRFVHLANNIKGVSPPALVYRWDAAVTGLQWFMPVSARDITNLVQTDIKITPDIARCEGVDCDVQRWEFAPTSNETDFQELWSHKYLLDMDGASASTRFLPMLRSRSLPLRASIMQEWWHDRVVPWMHYVPLDVRGSDFWSILAWFSGVDGDVNGQHFKLLPLADKGELMANAGRQWAEAALRKEDMEIYFFRLLLEWARITDDNREDIGFT
ncbi:hypothetical protein AMS68_001418 [Peltaster fructicola]|uniref:Glycosyl transferase CAP10 domain-containing protein n=1 Tax=Peltaster fructicola TaxID=286661 RepID=A0A6H0XMN1_9PEZI|nr:hypothetical protein AMS68_001418 [Peltaster fructicola]